MYVKSFYWELPCDHHSLERPDCLLSFVHHTKQVPAVIAHPDLGIHTLTDWKERWQIPNSRLWCEGSSYSADYILSHYFKDSKNTKNTVPFLSLTIHQYKNILFFDTDINQFRFVADGQYCLSNESNHDMLLRLYPSYAI